MRAVEIFAGVGGLALGVSQAGFHHDAVVEQDAEACKTIRDNKEKGLNHVKDWPLYECSVQDFDFSEIASGLDLLCGGPPCQPFSLAGKSLGSRDTRDMFPQAVKAVRALRPKAFAFENVNGLLRPHHALYAEYLRLQLACPHVEAKPREKHDSHISRLEKAFTGGWNLDEKYNVIVHSVNAADFGIPQRRMRVFIVGIRADLGISWAFPDKTHSRDSLLYSKFIDKSYWEEHCVPRRRREEISLGVKRRLERLKDQVKTERWITVRDAFKDLGEPDKRSSPSNSNHIFVGGARSYVGHTGSEWDWPSKTLKAGVHGVPGGENMLRKINGKVRYYSVREQARLQTFPDEYTIEGTWSATTRQLGNAVPVALASVLGSSLYRSLS